jgi:hypothetical protein
MSLAPEEPSLPEWTVLLEDGTEYTFDSDAELLAAFPDGEFADVVAQAVEAVRGWDDPFEIHAAAAVASETRVFAPDGTPTLCHFGCTGFPVPPARVQAFVPLVLRDIPCTPVGLAKPQQFSKVLIAPTGQILSLQSWAGRARSGLIS